MWPFRRRQEQPDELLGAVKNSVIAALALVGTRVTELEHSVKLVREEATEARAIERRLAKTENGAHSTRELLVDQVARLDQAIQNVRGMSTGGRTAGRRGAAADVGEQLIAMLGGQEQAIAFLEQLAQHGQGGGGGAPQGSLIAGDVPIQRRGANGAVAS